MWKTFGWESWVPLSVRVDNTDFERLGQGNYMPSGLKPAEGDDSYSAAYTSDSKWNSNAAPLLSKSSYSDLLYFKLQIFLQIVKKSKQPIFCRSIHIFFFSFLFGLVDFPALYMHTSGVYHQQFSACWHSEKWPQSRRKQARRRKRSLGTLISLLKLLWGFFFLTAANKVAWLSWERIWLVPLGGGSLLSPPFSLTNRALFLMLLFLWLTHTQLWRREPLALQRLYFFSCCWLTQGFALLF